MNRIKLIGLFMLLTVLGVIISLFVSFNIIAPILSGDLDKYYNQERSDNGKIFNFFFDINSSTGYLPEPSMNNLYLTILVGVIMGFVGFRIIKNRIKT